MQQPKCTKPFGSTGSPKRDFLYDIFGVELSHVCRYFRLFRNARPEAVIVILERAPDG
ncbi:hypothetical protein FHX59_004623 [Paraburkholderia silvatlantica]|uniref:Uncharacterized protein n=1 Tax=Paraburkholderia silvatlantica TaxID=321895 RepID=A0A2U0ZMT4_9BURK|nr:hypothetical protein [Paraburkholderia silvatlantica]PVY20158.1 hypothetical protein C7411_1402 [Paraburkholderia silvatlantica]PXW24629.1 hypothetical protein C7413_1432 [Paraburkholderia silvatlantica]PYE18300.1 hypothetical protein C7410_1222 [Paraburkholderia silvatlantica]TDQ97926.1 hypothetical protein C7412_107257 [Paraburkholderia silvatlantica]